MNINAPESTDELTDITLPLRIGLVLFALVFGVFGLWASIAPLDGAAHAFGRVTVASHSKTAQHLEGGIIAAILVKNGDYVEQDQLLIKLDETQSLAQLDIVRKQYNALRLREARLNAEKLQLPSVDYPELENVTAADIAAEEQVFAARKAAISAGTDLLVQRIEQLRSQLNGIKALKESKDALAQSYQEELTDIEELLGQGYSDKNRLRELQRALATAKGESADLTANIASIDVQIGETQLEIMLREREFQNEVVAELADTQNRLNDVAERITALRDVVSRTSVRSPVAGTIKGMQFHTVGGVIAPGTKIVDIVPEDDELIVEAQISPNDIDRIALHQQANIRFSSFGNAVPNIIGKLTYISADIFVDENSGLPYYQARIEVTEEGFKELGDLELVPGMPAEVFVATGSRTFFQYLFKPLSNAIARSFNED
ncbi:MAG: HlyD family type I secretion periplasmic adaptor subunit [Pseudomonadales bacterium]